MDEREKGWNPALVIFVFALLQGLILVIEWFFMAMAYAQSQMR